VDRGEESRRPQDADDQLGRDELVSDAEGVPERMHPPGEPGLVADAQRETKRIDEDDAPDEGGEEAGAESPLASEDPAEQDTGEQS
jgi:hypothetical protein